MRMIQKRQEGDQGWEEAIEREDTMAGHNNLAQLTYERRI